MRIKIFVLLFIILILATMFIIAKIETPVAINEEIGEVQEERTNEELIYDLLLERLGNETSACAIMGNLKKESNLCPYRYESDYSVNYEYSYELYEIHKDKEQTFVYSAFAFGLAQWTGSFNLNKLWKFCKENGYEVGTIEGQIAFLLYDLENNYPNLWKRLLIYKPSQIVIATEDFRQSYEKCVLDINSQYMRARFAKTFYLTLASNNEDDVLAVADAYYDFNIQHQVERIMIGIDT